jgi:hypothetical protein
MDIKRLASIALAGFAVALVPRLAASQQSDWHQMHELGVRHDTAWDLYMTLKREAGGGAAPADVDQLPDWSGLWTIDMSNLQQWQTGSFFQPGPDGTRPKLTPAAVEMQREADELAARGVNYDENLSQCGPPGFPRWLSIPFMREFIVRPEQTWLSSETVNNVRRIYTDGRDHPPELERYPLYYGDSIGFWHDQKLVIHTNQLMSRPMGRLTLTQSEQIEVVEIWEKVADDRIRAQAWLYDPALLEEAWYIERFYAYVPNPDGSLRMRFWHCGENQNNAVFQTEEGSTQFSDFTFTSDDDR